MKEVEKTFKPDGGPAGEGEGGAPFETDPKVCRQRQALRSCPLRASDAPEALKDAGNPTRIAKIRAMPPRAQGLDRAEADDAGTLVAGQARRQGRYEEAEKSARKALSIDPESPGARSRGLPAFRGPGRREPGGDLSRVGFRRRPPPEAASPGAGGASAVPGGPGRRGTRLPAGASPGEIMRLARRKLALGDPRSSWSPPRGPSRPTPRCLGRPGPARRSLEQAQEPQVGPGRRGRGAAARPGSGGCPA